MSNPANQLPPEYDDIQPSDYDPAFTADISTQMRVPERISAFNDNQDQDDLRQMRNDDDDMQRSASMNVPEKIVVMGDDKHMGIRDMPKLHLDSYQNNHAAEAYVGLSTPPRVLTMDDHLIHFPHTEDREDPYYSEEDTPKRQPPCLQNGFITPVRTTSESLELQALRATPGDPLLITDDDDDDVSVMKKRMDKLALHVYRLEEENSKRSQREWVLYPLVMVYFIFKMGQWFNAK